MEPDSKDLVWQLPLIEEPVDVQSWMRLFLLMVSYSIHHMLTQSTLKKCASQVSLVLKYFISVKFTKSVLSVAELPMNCDDVVHRIPQRVLDGQADATVDAATQVDCIRRCITASVSSF